MQPTLSGHSENAVMDAPLVPHSAPEDEVQPTLSGCSESAVMEAPLDPHSAPEDEVQPTLSGCSVVPDSVAEEVVKWRVGDTGWAHENGKL